MESVSGWKGGGTKQDEEGSLKGKANVQKANSSEEQ